MWYKCWAKNLITTPLSLITCTLCCPIHLLPKDKAFCKTPFSPPFFMLSHWVPFGWHCQQGCCRTISDRCVLCVRRCVPSLHWWLLQVHSGSWRYLPKSDAPHKMWVWRTGPTPRPVSSGDDWWGVSCSDIDVPRQCRDKRWGRRDKGNPLFDIYLPIPAYRVPNGFGSAVPSSDENR